jgi:hypothetical protein
MINLLTAGIWGLLWPLLGACAILAPFLLLIEWVKNRNRKRGKVYDGAKRSPSDNKIW